MIKIALDFRWKPIVFLASVLLVSSGMSLFAKKADACSYGITFSCPIEMESQALPECVEIQPRPQSVSDDGPCFYLGYVENNCDQALYIAYFCGENELECPDDILIPADESDRISLGKSYDESSEIALALEFVDLPESDEEIPEEDEAESETNMERPDDLQPGVIFQRSSPSNWDHDNPCTGCGCANTGHSFGRSSLPLVLIILALLGMTKIITKIGRPIRLS